ncbi:DNA polymerase III subunit gamma and tau [Asanoa sp. NPDC049573]|uniref:DNA polymerase III subunit gamma and tau n=1 Tax=Asanoa sp. NPDC049573 TaxID=3155396 RepID=UPI0034201F88
MALALYRKYRPRTFAEVIGQDHVTEPLSQALRSGRLNHAYLFSGPRGCGKTSSARILARSLNCERGPTPEPCGVCESCRALAPDGSGSIDVIEIDAASHGGVDDARELRERAFFAPAASRFKIYVIDEAHMVSTQGFNALLKLVEEPPDYVKFIFATTEPDKVLGTIKSRTHHYPFRLIPPGILRPYLEQLADAENVKVDPAVFPLVVRAGGGSARDSLSVLDQLIAGAGPEGVTYPRAAALLGVTDAALIDEMCDALAAGDGAAAYATIDRVAEAGHDPRRFASDLLERLRDLIVMQQVPEAAAKGLIDGPADQLERMSAQTQRLGPATLSRSADIVHNGLIEMRGTTAPRLLLELITARMLLPTGESGLLQRLERMERRLSIAGDQDFEPGEAADDYSGPAVLAAHGSAASARPQAGTAEHRPAANYGSGSADDGGPGSAGGGGSRPAGGGAAAARAAAAAAASRSGGARRGDGGPSGNVAASGPGDARRGDGGSAAANGPGGASRGDGGPAAVNGPGGASRGDGGPAAANGPGGAGRSDGGSTDNAPGGGDPAAAGSAGGPRRTQVVDADDQAGGDDGSRPAGDSADGGRRGDAAPADEADPLAAADADFDPATRGGSRDQRTERAASTENDAPRPGGLVDEPVAVTGNDDGERRPRRVPPQAVMADPATPEPVIPEAAAPGALDAASVRRVWDEIVAMVRVNNKKIAALASEATVRDIDGDTLVLTFRHAFHARTLAENPEAVVDAIYEVLGGRWQIRCELAGDQRGAAAGPPPAARPSGGREPSGNASVAGGRETSGNGSAAGGLPPGRERGGRERSSSGQGESGASGDRSDEDHQAARTDDFTSDRAHPPQRSDRSAREAGGPSPSRAGNPVEEQTPASDDFDSGWDEVEPPAEHDDFGPGQTRATQAGGARPTSPDRRGADNPGQRAELAADQDRRRPDGHVRARQDERPPAADAAERHATAPGAESKSTRSDDGTARRPAASGGGRAGAEEKRESSTATTRNPVQPADDDDWPETALPGGQSADDGDGDWPETPTPTFSVPQARNEVAESPGPVVAATATATVSAAVTATKPAKSTPGSVGAAAAARAAARAAAGGRAKLATPQADPEFAGEPPFDPDYDGPAKGAERKPRFEGFEPGDEPTDDIIDEKTARQSSEQQAFALLHEALGAERIGEIDLK